MNQCDSYFLRH